MTACVAQQAFDTEAFGRPFFRVLRLDAPDLESEIVPLRELAGVIIDAKMPAEVIEPAMRLQRLGFRKVTIQVELVDDCIVVEPEGEGTISERLDLPVDEVAHHAENFVYDRFALDVAIEKAGHDRFYRQWITNSLTGGRHRVAHLHGGFISFKIDGRALKIDLVSVVAKGKGIGSRLLRAVKRYARQVGCDRIQVITECENAPALKLYRKSGFREARYISVLHFAEARGAATASSPRG
jgi:dTDP-4-amino-4,6-dideoxy-D-galactose acyltransferase